ncbi:methionine S-methyltransferase [Selaginella moellendorffii]|uniref:methionine S-methyltransferase n=1 Tax=Selaginella moellendorffii TaxID=88036 RepID=UPI000D1C8AD2|nr:methionine S-methyltransferase [Selaginella moellendorffii]|eukprot:XP_024516277.1 methionine S-methyltransferase [Selaginella moellendorffii]
MAAAAAGEMAEVKRFLDECRESGDKTYGVFKGVLDELQNETTRSRARKLLASVERYVDAELSTVDCFATFHFRIHQLVLSDSQGLRKNRQKLTLLELPSIFIPEDWSFTFYEGINRLPDSGFHDRDVAELGCGNGWVSIAIAEKLLPRKVYGLDINPRAIKVAWINLYLNALSGEDGSLVIDREGKSLLDRVEFYVSDLLGYCRDRNIMLDRVVGCIPQVLNPDPEAMLKLVSENASEDFLYSLSNYCGLQGFVEDQFGLGLIARAAEEGISVIKPNGAMIFNIGGRPGQAVCERLFERRGFKIAKLWQTRVKQAADTDILALVQIEKNSRHRFEFFMGLLSEEPICARTAWAYSRAGGEISHGLSVYKCELRHPNEIKTIFKFLNSKIQELRGALDLSFSEESVAEEKIPFLAYLANALEGLSYIPCELPVGSTNFRSLIAGFFRIYHGIPLTPANVVVQPSRSVLIENILRLYQPKLALIDAMFTRWLPKKWLTVLPHQSDQVSSSEIAVVEAPHRTDLVIQLLRHLKPQIVITSLADFEMRTSTAFEQLLHECAEVGARLFLDISDYVELSSAPGTNGVLQYMAAHALPSHATIMSGLVKNKVYADLEVAFLISENKDVLHALALSGELVDGRTAVMNQFYYGCLLHELLSFHLPERHTTSQRLIRQEESSKFIRFADCTRKAIVEAEVCSSGSLAANAIHLDIDENALPTPLAVKAVIFEAFCRQNVSEAETDPKPEILDFIKAKCLLGPDYCGELVLGDSCLSLFSNLVLGCVEDKGTLCFPAGCNGTYLSTATFYDADLRRIQTKKGDGFKLTAHAVEETIRDLTRPWLYISGPTVSPTGVLYSSGEIISILSVCEKAGARVIIDTSFSGLEYDSSRVDWDLKSFVGRASGSNKSFAVALLGGFSTELLSGGHEYGFVTFTSSIFSDAFKDAPLRKTPHMTSNYMIKKLLAMANSKSSSRDLPDGVRSQQLILKQRAEKMKEALVACGWEVLEPQGGISLVARPSAYEGRTFSYKSIGGETTKEIKLDSVNIREAMLCSTGVCVSSSQWTGLEHYCRFVIAVSDDKFDTALKALRRFKDLVLG